MEDVPDWTAVFREDLCGEGNELDYTLGYAAFVL
jgi:hypothetical protein